MPTWLRRLVAYVGIVPADHLRVPLRDRVNYGSLHLWADVRLLVQGPDLRYFHFRWRVDSGATLTKINWQDAVDAGFPTGQAGPEVTVRETTAAGPRPVTIPP